jgi:hypothetical protein
MLPGKQILKRISCLLLVFVHISFTCFQINYQSSVLRCALLLKQSVATEDGEKGSQPATFVTASDILSKSRLVPVKRFFQDESILITAPGVTTRIVFVPYQFHRYISPPVNKFSAHTCPERGPPVAVRS